MSIDEMEAGHEIPIPLEYNRAGYHFIECPLCGERFNAGRSGNSAGARWTQGIKTEWWAKHTGIPQTRYALKLCEKDIPEICKALGAS